jgi:hypothetical protein
MMTTLHGLRPQIEQGKAAVLLFKDENGENVKVYIRKDAQERYTHIFSYPDRPNPFPRPRLQTYSLWEELIEAITDMQARAIIGA